MTGLLKKSLLASSLIFSALLVSPTSTLVRSATISAPNGMTSLAVPSAPLTPDQYSQYALQDPGFLSLKSSLKANEDAYKANARGGINRGVINLGLAPPDASVAGWIDPGTAAAAAANPLSSNAGLSTQHLANTRAIQNNLAARGAYDSGELTYGLGNENTRDTQAHADAMGKFLDYANGLFSNLGSMQASDASQLGSELGNAAMRQLALHPGSTVSAVWDDSRGAYVDSNGNLYDQWGNHIPTAPTDGSTAPTTNFGPIPPGNLAGSTVPPPDAVAGNSQYGGQYQVPNYTPPAPPDSIVGNSQYGGQYTPPPQPILTAGSVPRMS